MARRKKLKKFTDPESDPDEEKKDDSISDNITERIPVLYSKKQLTSIIKKIQILHDEIEILSETAKIHDNQKTVAKKVLINFKNRKVLCQLVIAKTQSGKTSAMIVSIDYITADDDLRLPVENIFIFTGLSSTEWDKQTKERFPHILHSNIMHGPVALRKMANKIRDMKNVLIIIDETQIASKEQQTIHRILENAGLYDEHVLFKQDIKILQFSATPNGVSYDIDRWGVHAEKLLMQPGKNYTGTDWLLENGKLYEYKPLVVKPSAATGNMSISEIKNRIRGFKGKKMSKQDIKLKKDLEINLKVMNKQQEKVLDALRELKEIIEQNFPDEKMYHIIRAPSKELQDELMDNIDQIFDDDDLYAIDTYNEENTYDINDMLKRKPSQHTFILIKERLRCSKTIYKKYIGVCYERYTEDPDDSVMNQSLAGRLTGYDYNEKSICFTHIESIKRYNKLWDNGFKDDEKNEIALNTATTRINKKGHMTLTATHAQPPTGIKKSTLKNPTYEYGSYIACKEFDTFKDLKSFYLKQFDKNDEKKLTEKKKKDAAGFVVENINNRLTIASVDVAKKSGTTLLKNKNKNIKPGVLPLNQNSRYLIGYTDATDNNTEKHILVYVDEKKLPPPINETTGETSDVEEGSEQIYRHKIKFDTFTDIDLLNYRYEEICRHYKIKNFIPKKEPVYVDESKFMKEKIKDKYQILTIDQAKKIATDTLNFNNRFIPADGTKLKLYVKYLVAYSDTTDNKTYQHMLFYIDDLDKIPDIKNKAEGEQSDQDVEDMTLDV